MLMFEMSISIAGGVPLYRRHYGGTIVVEWRMECGRVGRLWILDVANPKTIDDPKQQ